VSLQTSGFSTKSLGPKFRGKTGGSQEKKKEKTRTGDESRAMGGNPLHPVSSANYRPHNEKGRVDPDPEPRKEEVNPLPVSEVTILHVSPAWRGEKIVCRKQQPTRSENL